MIRNTLIEFLNTDGIFFIMIFAVGYPLLVTKSHIHTVKAVFTLLLTFLVTLILKELFTIPRPYILENREHYAGLTQFSSFPSSHTALAFAAATSVSFRQRTVGLVLLFIAILIGVGRVAANVHYPKDIFFGILIGILISTFVESLKKPDSLKYRKK